LTAGPLTHPWRRLAVGHPAEDAPMKLYTSVGPNPRVVKMFLAEKGLDVERVEVDLRAGENRRPPYSAEINRAGQLPTLELDEGARLCEVTAICEYVEETHPQ